MDRFEQCKEFMINKFRPELRDLFYTKGYERYKKYNFNSCRQTAVFGAFILRDAFPEYKWTACEGLMRTPYLGKIYEVEHAWIFGFNKQLGGIVVDLESPCIKVYKTDINELRSPRKILGKISRIDIEECVKEVEFLTMMNSLDILSMLRSKLSNDIKSFEVEYEKIIRQDNTR